MAFLRSHLEERYLGQSDEPQTAEEAAEATESLPADANGNPMPLVPVGDGVVLFGMTRQQLILIGALALVTCWVMSRRK